MVLNGMKWLRPPNFLVKLIDSLNVYKFSLGIVINEEEEEITEEVVDMEDREEAAASPYQQSRHSQLTLETYPIQQSKEILKTYLRI